jgi:hypothetical protein
LVNQVAANVPAAERYSYVFDGTAGYLDHALSTASVTAQLTDVAFWHINADEPSVIDYNTEFKTVDLYQPHMFRASDHDPVVLGLNLAAENIAPVAVDDTYMVEEDAVLTVAAPGVLANDYDTDGDVMTASILTDVSHGTLTLYLDGSFIYTPDAGFNGEDTFEYQLSTYPDDGKAPWTDVGLVTITVTMVNHDPVAVDDEYSLLEGETLTVAAPGVLANDEDVDGDSMSVSILVDVAHGTLMLYQDGSFIYTPDPGFFGVDSFEYQLTTYPAGAKGWTDTAVVTLTVNPLFRVWMPLVLR